LWHLLQVCYDWADEEKDRYLYESKEWRKRRAYLREQQKAARNLKQTAAAPKEAAATPANQDGAAEQQADDEFVECNVQ